MTATSAPMVSHPSAMRRVQRRRRKEALFRWLFAASTLFAGVVLVVLIAAVAREGLRHVDLEFLRQFPSSRARNAGVQSAVTGSLWVMVITALVSFPVGVGAAIYLEEYATPGRFSRFLEANISNLAGVPSIVYGLLGLGIFVRGMDLGRSVAAGGLTLGLLVMPMVIIATRESLRAVPSSLRHASYALGATKWQTIRQQVLPVALPGILTGMILALSRAIGETAPILLIGGVTFIKYNPDGLMSKFTVLPIQIYSWISRPQEEFHELAAAAILVLLAMLLSMNAVAIWLRNRRQVML
jgi:phosphate transport system permease protein